MYYKAEAAVPSNSLNEGKLKGILKPSKLSVNFNEEIDHKIISARKSETSEADKENDLDKGKDFEKDI